MVQKKVVLVTVVAASVVLGAWSCAATDGYDENENGNGNAGGSTGSFNPSGSGGSGGTQECAGIENQAQFVGANAYVLVDRSGSMSDSAKWPNTVQAFTTFFGDPGADSLDVALRFWPEGGCNESSCDIASCATPNVPMGSLMDAGHEQALINAFNAMYPEGLTPMSAALNGGTWYAGNLNQMSGEGGRQTVVIFLTDGMPTACDVNQQNIIQLAANAYNQTGTLTFAVGLAGSEESFMHALAAAGGTNMAFMIGNGNAAADLLAALQAIQATVLACSFAMPESQDPDHPIDPHQVNITYTAGGSSTPETIKQVPSAADCGPQGGWYYDDPQSPSSIHLCPATCELVQADESGSLKVVVGCATQVQ